MRRVLLLWCLSLFLAIRVGAAVIQVPADQPTIQAGIDAAVNGDTVLVSDGTFTGVGNRNITFTGKAIVVRSVNGAAVTIVDVEETSNRGFIFAGGEDTISVLDGFTVTRAIADSGAGILISGGSPKILNCRFEKMGFTLNNCNGLDLSIRAPLGLGVCVTGASHPRIRNCVFSKVVGSQPGIACQLWGAGLAVDAPATVVVEDCSFEDITAFPLDGGLGIAIYDGSQGSLYRRCQFLRNGNYFYNGATHATPVFLLNSTSRFDSCLFANNLLDAESFGSGIGSAGIWLYNSPAFLINCTFFGGATLWDWQPGNSLGGALAVLCTNSKATIANCIFAFCRTTNNPQPTGPRMPTIGFTIGDTVVPNISCTDIYGNLNLGGDWVGPIASQLGINGNIRRNPFFCDTTNYDFHLAPNSPCAPAATGCGLLGAYAVNPLCPPGNCCIGRTGNIDCDPDDKVDISDLSAMIDCLYIFPGSCNAHCCPGEENTDGDISGGVDISDLAALIDYLYISFTPTAMCR